MEHLHPLDAGCRPEVGCLAMKKHIDIKSLLIGFFFGTTLLLVTGQRFSPLSSGGTVKITGEVAIKNAVDLVTEGERSRRKVVGKNPAPW